MLLTSLCADFIDNLLKSEKTRTSFAEDFNIAQATEQPQIQEPESDRTRRPKLPSSARRAIPFALFLRLPLP
jgi:hypothetical protein